MNIGFIGTGMMGSLMVRSLLNAGHTVTIYDRRADAVKPLAEVGALAARSARAVAAASEVVLTSLPGPAQVEEVLLDPKDGILAGLSSGGAFIDTTTNSPVMIKRLAEACRARSVEILDAPVTGRPPGMVMMVGGERRVFNKYQPVMQCMAEGVFYMGDLGQGMIAKAANQLIGFTSFFGIVEALLIGAKAGMDIGAFVEMYSARRGANPQLERLAPVFKGVYDGYPINVALKDASVACELAESAGMDAPMAFLTRRILERGQTEGLGEEPFGHVVRMLEELAGVELRISSATTWQGV